MERGKEIKQQTSLGRQLTTTTITKQTLCVFVCINNAHGVGGEICIIHHTVTPPLTSTSRDSISSWHLANAMQRRFVNCIHARIRMSVGVCCEMRDWAAGRCKEGKRKDRSPGKQSDCAGWWMLRELLLSSLSSFLFLCLSPTLPSLRLFLQTRWQHQSKKKSPSITWHARTHTHKLPRANTQWWWAPLENDLFVLKNNFF